MWVLDDESLLDAAVDILEGLDLSIVTGQVVLHVDKRGNDRHDIDGKVSNNRAAVETERQLHNSKRLRKDHTSISLREVTCSSSFWVLVLLSTL